MKMRILVVVVLVMLCAAVWAQGVPVQQENTTVLQTETTVFQGQTQLYIDWSRQLTDCENAFLATVPKGCDASGQNFRGLIEICFRTKVAHADSAPRYGYVDSKGICYDYSYFCRQLQSADAGHVSKTEIPVATLPELGELGEVSPVEKLSLTPATLKEVTLDFLPLEGGKICTSVASPPCGGAIERGNPASEVRETVGALTIIPERMPKQPCHPKPPPPPPPTGCDPDDSAPLPPPAIW